MTDFIDGLVSKAPLRVSRVEIDGLEEPLYVREMDAEAMDAFLSIRKEREADEDFSIAQAADVAVLHISDEAGNLLVKREDRKDAAQKLQRLRYSVVSKLFIECLKVSGLSQDEVAEAAGN